MARQVIVYQVINFDRQEMFFGRSDIMLEKEITRIAKDPKGPARDWKRGDLVHWRPLTDLIDDWQARALHRDLEKKTPPNKFHVIPTYEGDPEPGSKRNDAEG